MPANELAEFISRDGRVRIVELILGNGQTVQKLADELGVSRQTIYLWLDPHKTHPCNPNLGRLLDLAASVDEAGTIEILWNEATLFRSMVRKFEMVHLNKRK